MLDTVPGPWKVLSITMLIMIFLVNFGTQKLFSVLMRNLSVSVR